MVVKIDEEENSIGVKIFRKYGSCKIEYINNNPYYYYMKGDNDWVLVKPSQFSSL